MINSSLVEDAADALFAFGRVDSTSSAVRTRRRLQLLSRHPRCPTDTSPLHPSPFSSATPQRTAHQSEEFPPRTPPRWIEMRSTWQGPKSPRIFAWAVSMPPFLSEDTRKRGALEGGPGRPEGSGAADHRTRPKEPLPQRTWG